jgi:ataxia telangiectasia mutated family protein
MLASCRETTFSTLSKDKTLQDILSVSQKSAREVEIKSLLASSAMSRRHGALQNSLATTTDLSQLVKPCNDLGLRVNVAADVEASNVLWDQGEMSASIRMLRDLAHISDLSKQDISVGRPEILAKLVRYVHTIPIIAD